MTADLGTVPPPSPETAPESAPEVRELLFDTDHSLGSILERTVGPDIRLIVVGQSTISPPHPPWVSPPLGDDRDLRLRVTSYRLGDEALSWNLAFLDEERIGKTLARDLRTGRIHLGSILGQARFAKGRPTVGTHEDAGDLAGLLGRAFSGPLGAFAWRHYGVEAGGQPSMVIVEALPIGTCRRLLSASLTSGPPAEIRK